MTNVHISASKEYDVYIGRGLLPQSGNMIAGICCGGTAMLVCDDVVSELYGDIVDASLRDAGYKTHRFVFPNGENSKNMETFTSLLNALAGAGLTRSDVVIALGGGVTGDMSGFAAAAYLRGIKFAQMPTTLLAMVDSSVGGKTGIDLPQGKNLVGAFYQPDIVVCDVDTLATLPNEVFTDGCAEVIKHGVILSSELFHLLKEPIHPSDSRMESIISLNITIKREVVVADEKETGVRKILNFGHTLGHAVEKLSGYTVSHGSAVAIGMAVCSKASYKMGFCGQNCFFEIEEILERYGLPTTTDFSAAQLLEAALYDKKRSGGIISLIIPESIGKCVIHDFDMDELAEFIKLGVE